jgi:protein gp37
MGDTSNIEWTDRTFNPWWGCSRVSPACRFCYADRDASRWGHELWRRNGERKPTSEAYWRKPHQWNREAERTGIRSKVFCASMADVFEDHPQVGPWRERLWTVIESTPWLTWQLLTKRMENVAGMVPWSGAWPRNVWIGTSVENQRFADQRIPVLTALTAAPVRFLSCEPILGPLASAALDGISWCIAGGESGPKARISHPDWFRSLRDRCVAGGIPFLFKQWGQWAPVNDRPAERDVWLSLDGKAVPWQYGDGHLRVGAGDFRSPRGSVLMRRHRSKHVAGRELDGREWSEYPGGES